MVVHLLQKLSWKKKFVLKKYLIFFLLNIHYLQKKNVFIWKKGFKATEHEYIFSKYSRNLNISEIFWSCYTKNNFSITFPKYKKPHFLTSIKPVWFETRNFLMRLKKIYWNWGISFVFKSKHIYIYTVA